MKQKVIIKEIDIPEIQKPDRFPTYDSKDYEKRYSKLKEIMLSRNLDYIIIYGDMWQFANIHYFMGIDLKFEQALLIIGKETDPIFIAGNEGLPYAKHSTYKKLITLLFQPFSLQGQPHDKSVNLKHILTECGINKKSNIGLIGAKYYPYYLDGEQVFDSPSYIIDTIKEIVGSDNMKNATDVMTHCEYGLRNILSSKDIAFMECAGRLVCHGVKNVIENIKLGINEVEASSYFNNSLNLPFSVPVIFGFGDKAYGNLAGPTYESILKKGDLICFGFGLWGALMGRSGLAISSSTDFSNAQRQANVLENFFIPYFKAIVKWYENVRVGCTGGDVYRGIEEFVSNPAFGVGLNPGHLIHWDEWTNSPFYKNSNELLHSGMAIQCDIIASNRDLKLVLTVEDGIVLADRDLQAELNSYYPGLMARVIRRRDFLSNVLGINIDETVCPLSDMQAMLHPYFLNHKVVLAIEN